jgi:formate dehydrogenase iron-sulfur subunit
MRAVQVGGPLGAYVPASQFDLPLDYEALRRHGAMVGHGGIVVFDDTVDMAQHGPLRDGILRHRILRQVHALPHRLDARRRGHRPHHRRRRPGGQPRPARVDLCDTMLDGSLCALGGMTPYPVLSALNHFPEDFGIAPKRLSPAA